MRYEYETINITLAGRQPVALDIFQGRNRDERSTFRRLALEDVDAPRFAGPVNSVWLPVKRRQTRPDMLGGLRRRFTGSLSDFPENRRSSSR
jgi:hypothetical protein